MNIIKEQEYPDHICRFNDEPQVCCCYKDGRHDERSQLLQEIEERVRENVQEAIKDPQSDNYIYAEYIPLSRLSKIFNNLK